MTNATSELFSNLLSQIEEFEPSYEAVEVGIVEEVGDGIARVSGLENIQFGGDGAL